MEWVEAGEVGGVGGRGESGVVPGRHGTQVGRWKLSLFCLLVQVGNGAIRCREVG